MRIPDKTFSGNLRQLSVPSPVGLLTLVVSESGVRSLLWEGERPGACIPNLMSSDQEHLNVSDCVYRQLDEYFRGVRTSFDVELDLVGTPFQRQAWEALRAIPYGQTVSYAQQALSLGSKNLARAVGGANRRNPVSIIVPCHRVIGKSGALTGFAGGLSAKSGLLGHE